VVNEPLFLQQDADALQPLHFRGVMKQNPVRVNVGVLVAALAQFAAELRLVRAVGLVDVEDDFVQFERVVVNLAQFHLPRADINLLKGIHPDAAELLKDKNICPKALRLFKRVNANRQIEMAEMMVTMNNYVAGYAEALVLGTPQHQLVNPDEPKKKAGMSAEDIARMESEMESLERDLKAVTDNYTENIFTLQTAQTYIKNLLKNAKVVRYLNANHAEIYSEFESIAMVEAV
jgi:hypothetical protein